LTVGSKAGLLVVWTPAQPAKIKIHAMAKTVLRCKTLHMKFFIESVSFCFFCKGGNKTHTSFSCVSNPLFALVTNVIPTVTYKKAIGNKKPRLSIEKWGLLFFPRHSLGKRLPIKNFFKLL
jgi:hypothetical protein